MEYLNADGTPMSLDQRSDLERNRRNKYLMLYVDSVNAVRWAAMPTAQQNDFIEYRQQLLSVPQQEGFPLNIIWPAKPEGV